MTSESAKCFRALNYIQLAKPFALTTETKIESNRGVRCFKPYYNTIDFKPIRHRTKHKQKLRKKSPRLEQLEPGPHTEKDVGGRAHRANTSSMLLSREDAEDSKCDDQNQK